MPPWLIASISPREVSDTLMKSGQNNWQGPLISRAISEDQRE